MNITPILNLVKIIAFSSFFVLSGQTTAAQEGELVDDFNDELNNSFGLPRQYLNDTVAGGNTSVKQTIANGNLQVKGELVPPRGQPGWASSVFLLTPNNSAADLSQFEGIKLNLKVNQGNVSISANSTEVTNFDYHTAILAVQSDDNFHEVKIPFSSMKRLWSEQTQLNAKTISSLSLVAFGLKKEQFDFTVNEISFY